MKRFLISKASLDDWQAMRDLEMDCFSRIDVFKPRQIRRLLSSPLSLAYVIRDRGKIVASIIGLLRRFRIPSGRIYKIAVSSESRGLGLASQLLVFVEKKFLRANVTKCCAEVRVSNKGSQHLFQKNGYWPAGNLPAYYPDGEDGVKFWKKIR